MNEWEWQLLENKAPVKELEIAGSRVKPRDRVRLRPRRGGDVLDIALAGQLATIEAIEQDYEGRFHVCVVLDHDPGRDLGLLRQPGHRFFFTPEEVEPVPPQEAGQAAAAVRPRVLVAGIGNIFFGDDGFGVEVAQRLASRGVPAGARVWDFGIRSMDLAYALQDGYEAVVLVDAYPHGEVPGTLYVVEPDLRALGEEGATLDAHGMDPVKVLRMAASMGALPKRILLLGCEPATLGPEEGQVGLSEVVAKSVNEAAAMLEKLVAELMGDTGPGQGHRFS